MIPKLRIGLSRSPGRGTSSTNELTWAVSQIEYRGSSPINPVREERGRRKISLLAGTVRFSLSEISSAGWNRRTRKWVIGPASKLRNSFQR